MCDPVTTVALGSAALSAGAGAYQTVRSNTDARRAESARSNAALAELERQKGYRTQAQTALTGALSNAQPEAQTRNFADAVGQRQALVSAAAPPPEQYSAGSPNAPALVRNAATTTMDKAKADAAARSAALARVFAYGDTAATRGIGIGRAGGELNQIGNIAGVSNSINSAEQQTAYNNAIRPPSTGAALAGGLGDIGLMLALSGQVGGGQKMATPPAPRLKPRSAP